MKIPKIPKNQ